MPYPDLVRRAPRIRLTPGQPVGTLPFTAVLLCLAGLVLLPGPRYQLFAGLPADTFPSLVALVLLVPIIASGWAREKLKRLLSYFPGRLRAGAFVIVLLAVVGKLALLSFGPVQPGFVGCYRPLPAQGEQCASSFTNAFGQVAGTRLDTSIAFGASTNFRIPPAGLSTSNWNFMFANQTRFNYFEVGEPLRDRLPFEASWRGRLDVPAGRSVVVRYVGQGMLTLDGKESGMPPSYGKLGTVLAATTGNDPELHLVYSFTHVVLNDQTVTTPYAALLVGLGAPRGATPVQAANLVGPEWQALADAVDAVTVAVLLLLCLGYFLTLGTAALAMLGLAAWMCLVFGAMPPLSAEAQYWVLVAPGLWLLVLLLVFFNKPRQQAFLAAFFAVTAFAGCAAARSAALSGAWGLNRVVYDPVGNDPLTYMSQGYSILATGSLKGGETIFFYSPGYRYFLFLLHIVFGDGAAIASAAMFAGMYAGVAFVAIRLWRPPPVGDGSARGTRTTLNSCGLLLTAVPYLIIAWFVSSTGTGTFLSETLTWVALLFAGPLLLAPRRRADIVLGSALAGVAFLTRVDQLPGVLCLVVLSAVTILPAGGTFLAGASKRSLTHLYLGCGVLLVFIAGLPALHNLYYGGRLVLTPGEATLPLNMPFPPSDVLKLLKSAVARSTLFSQLRGVFVLPSEATFVRQPFPAAVHIMQVLWLGAVVVAVALRKSLNWRTSALLLIPVAFLGPYIFAQVYVYYPRHVVAGYLMAAVATLAFVGNLKLGASHSREGTAFSSSGDETLVPGRARAPS
jgi:hypothetical protein